MKLRLTNNRTDHVFLSPHLPPPIVPQPCHCPSPFCSVTLHNFPSFPSMWDCCSPHHLVAGHLLAEPRVQSGPGVLRKGVASTRCEIEHRDRSRLPILNLALHEDREAGLAAMTQNGVSFQYAAEPMKADKEVCLAGVTQNGELLQYAAGPMRADKEVCLAAVTQNEMFFNMQRSP